MIFTEKPDMIQPEFAFSEMESTKSTPEESVPTSDVIPEPKGEHVNKRRVDFKADNVQAWLL